MHIVHCLSSSVNPLIDLPERVLYNRYGDFMLNDNLTVYGKTIPNRVVFNPMEGCDGTFAGGIGELTKRRYLRFAESGAGIIWFEATAVSSECRANPRQLFLTPETADGFKKLLDEIRERALKTGGPVPLLVLQSTNSGRWSKPDGAPRPIVAYRNALWEKGKEDLEYITASDDYCKALSDKYEKAARLASDAGFDGIDVKCSHGYLLNEFLSAYDRPGIYGGCFENRTRLFFECVDAALANAGKDTFVTTRLNACDCFPHPFGFGTDKNGNPDLRETKQIISLLAGKGVGLINLTLGNPYLIPHINRPCRNAPEPEETGLRRIRDITGELQKAFPEIPFVIPGLSCLAEKSVDYAETALKEGVCSLAGWGRMTLCYPVFYKDWLRSGKPDRSKCCLACGKCTELMRAGTVSGCPARDKDVYLPLYRKEVMKCTQ